MTAQVFRGRTLADARRAVFDKLGPEAVVLTTRAVRRNGLGGVLGGSDVEIAALATEPAPAPRTAAEVPFAKGVYVEPPRAAVKDDVAALRAELKGDIRALKTMLTKDNEWPQVVEEIAQLRELVEGLAKAKTTKSDKVIAQLQALGIEGPGATAIARKLRKPGHTSDVRQELSSLLQAGPWPLDDQRSFIALVGPSGVGKTTTAAKLVARARMAGKTAMFVACDTYRVGAVEQLSRYAELLGVECRTARNADELRAIIESAEVDVVVVDTSGRPPTADGVETAVAPPRKGGRPWSRARHVLLCVSASIRAVDAARVARRYAPLGPTALVVTKIDETDAPAGIVHASCAAKMPISVLCNGQRVPEDIAPATAEALLGHFTLPQEEREAVA
jgi:flagellar biosynthesis protein FlhF